ncbi:MAG: FixH family protein [Gammaproteobacteria bacterium]|nr:FixH family protein [Gammaproteobacteria bacterium]
MVSNAVRRYFLFAALSLLVLPGIAHAHGGVVDENDLCIINIGYLKARFKIYVPQQTGHDEYCEDIPVRGESVFIMEYQHDGLSEAEIDFRIIKNVTGKSTFAQLDDVLAIDDIDAVTIHYAPPRVVPDVFTLLQSFDEDGEYIGIVSATRTDTGKVYTTVFPFEVGYIGAGVWPWLIAGFLVLQFNYWFMSRRRTKAAAIAAVILVVSALQTGRVVADETSWASKAGYFQVQYASNLEPIVINKIHSWILQVESADGKAVTGAEITIDGGMPEHNHGLPTLPRVVEELGEGRYRVAGMRFHMGGYWELRISIAAGSRRDDVLITLNL